MPDDPDVSERLARLERRVAELEAMTPRPHARLPATPVPDPLPPRRASAPGLGVAVVKVLSSDLSYLDALYRIGSVFILGTVSLALAWLYHRHARAKTENA